MVFVTVLHRKCIYNRMWAKVSIQQYTRMHSALVACRRRCPAILQSLSRGASPISCMDATIIARSFHNPQQKQSFQSQTGITRKVTKLSPQTVLGLGDEPPIPDKRHDVRSPNRTMRWGPSRNPDSRIHMTFHRIGMIQLERRIEKIRNLLTHCTDQIKSNRFKLQLFFSYCSFCTSAIGSLLTSISVAVIPSVHIYCNRPPPSTRQRMDIS